ncbi:MAG: RNA polymerase sigma factor [Spirosomaceae bacterium]|nr:RNA polymerase sigma factor [Spirosomataceae bacterium]
MSSLRNISQVVEDCIQGKESAMKAFYEHFHGFALGVCMGYAENRDDALEMMHDGFLKIFKNLHKVENLETIKAWIRRVMVNIAIDYHRRNVKRQLTQLTENEVSRDYGDENIYAVLSSEDIIKAIQKLPQTYRTVFNLYVIEGYSHKEIGDLLNIAESTSRAHLSVANSMLRKYLNKLMN